MKSAGSNCDRNSLIGWLDESLTEEANARLRDHLTTCDACKIQLKSLESTLDLARSALQPLEMGPFEAPAFVHKVRGRIAAKQQGAWKRLLSPALGGGFISGAVVGALALFVAIRPVSDSDIGIQAPVVAAAEPAAGSEVGDGADAADEATEEAQLAGAIDDYLLDTASEQELFSEMETLIGEEDVVILPEAALCVCSQGCLGGQIGVFVEGERERFVDDADAIPIGLLDFVHDRLCAYTIGALKFAEDDDRDRRIGGAAAGGLADLRHVDDGGLRGRCIDAWRGGGSSAGRGGLRPPLSVL